MAMVDNIPTVQLWIGAPADVAEELHPYLTQLWCTSVCGTCAVCHALREQRYARMHWLKPERDTYVREQIDTVLAKVHFALDADDRQVMVIQSAELLTASSANRLLKTLEEPHEGWIFILTAQRPDLVLPTIRSRCQHVYEVKKTAGISEHPLMICFLKPSAEALPHFIATWETTPISAAETVGYLDYLGTAWRERYSKHPEDETRSKAVLAIIDEAMRRLPMPGGQTLFWRLLLLKLIAVNKKA
jgi:hypothetical protein